MMRNCNIREANNGWVLEVDRYSEAPYNPCEHSDKVVRGPYVFTDWSEMMEFIEDYFAEEE